MKQITKNVFLFESESFKYRILIIPAKIINLKIDKKFYDYKVAFKKAVNLQKEIDKGQDVCRIRPQENFLPPKDNRILYE